MLSDLRLSIWAQPPPISIPIKEEGQQYTFEYVSRPPMVPDENPKGVYMGGITDPSWTEIWSGDLSFSSKAQEVRVLVGLC